MSSSTLASAVIPLAPRHLALGLLFALALLAQFVLRADASLRQKSPVWDEQLHLRYGLAFLSQGPRAEPRDHAYLVAALLAAPVYGQKHGPHSAADLVIERPAHLFPARRANVALAAVGLGLLFCVLWRRLGGALALVFLAMGTFDPGWIAHARFVTTDTALGLSFALAALALAGHRESDSRAALVGAGVALGLGLTAKLSAVLLVPMPLLLHLIPATGESWLHGLGARARRGLLATAVIAGTGFSVFGLLLLGSALLHGGTAVDAWEHVWKGVSTKAAKRLDRPGTYLLGHFFDRATPLHYLVILATKTPLAILGLIVAALGIPEARAWLSLHRFLFVVPACYLLAMVTSGVNLGSRMLTPLLPALWLLATAGALGLARRFRHGRLSAAGLCAVLVVEVVLAHPHYLPFAHALAGGVDRAHRIVVDSSTDWGQDLPALAEYLRRAPPTLGPAHLAYFGNAIPAAYVGPTVWRPCGVLGFPPLRRQARAGCFEAAEVLAISATCWAGVTGVRTPEGVRLGVRDNCWAWLREQEPDGILGGSILVYRNPRSR